ncbi:LCP family protein [Pseudalkalibacillus caeni]|uniref:LytR family transcriptional regulator n=1 Tax=Exobacillus caeni TaxID=2574798 RepID=A0A5R9F3P6_9BACL|nr:LCP family protein [Pseudalkalibacillus caeni]TLS35074.1 LytR family transcriptional regulator [Pseudalkalibacillus caeni]
MGGEETRKSRLKQKKKKKKWVRNIFIVFLVLFAAVVGYGGYLYNKVSNVTKDSYVEPARGEKSELRKKEFDTGKDHFSVLFLGVDDRNQKTSTGRSDAMILATFNRDKNSVKLVSIPRDSYVEIPGHGKDKITHAHAFGGIDLTIETVEKLFDIPVDEVVRVNFAAFKTVINELGGINVTIEDKYVADQIRKETHGQVDLKVGEQELDGEAALAYARTRKADSDLKRGQRQMEIIKASINKLKSFSSVPKYGDVLDRIGENLTMSLTLKEAVGLYPFINSLDDIETLQLKGSDYWADRYYYKLDDESLEKIKSELKKHLEIDEASGES